MKTVALKGFMCASGILFLLGIMSGCGPGTSSPNETKSTLAYDQRDFPNLLDIKGIPDSPLDLSVYSFGDLGAWHTYSLPKFENEDFLGAIVGPYLLTHGNGTWLGQTLFKSEIVDLSDGATINLSRSDKTKIDYLPGKLVQSYEVSGIRLKIQLIFISTRSSLIEINIENVSKDSRDLKLTLDGGIWMEGAILSSNKNTVTTQFESSEIQSELILDGNFEVTIDSEKYILTQTLNNLGAGQNRTTLIAHSVTFNDTERGMERSLISNVFHNVNEEFQKNKQRWQGYLTSILTNPKEEWANWEFRKVVAVKSLLTLVTNWRSAAGELKHDGLFPSYAYRGFHGFWSWDSWKHAVGLVQFNPELAKDQVRAMFDYQDNNGMIADCIFRDTLIEKHNWRDTKPPLASWAVREIYNRTADSEFAKEMFPQLIKYHRWWYQFRDANKNNLCEFGSTDGTVKAAMWESGMDNAVRFDNAVIMGDSVLGWSLDQESVDLNAYLYHEKLILSELAGIIGEVDLSGKLKVEAKRLRELIVDRFYDASTEYFYDRNLGGELIEIKGPEAWTTLWTNVAEKTQARAVMKNMLDEATFNTFVPLPTLTASSEKFEPAQGYWRGPVWLDQAYFALEGLNNYGFHKEAQQLAIKLLEHMDGLTEKGIPIHENYNPQTGGRLNAPHFSWSAAHLLMLLNK